MARQWRISFPGALYHVMSRGNGRQDIFLSDADRHMFLALLEELSERFNVDIYAYVLMDNHYHLLLKTVEANISRAMQWLGTAYTRKFNLAHHTSGHLFQGRYKSIIVENDAYLLRLSCYIHRNPLRAGIVDRLADYRWSSYHYYAYKKKAPAWLITQPILLQLSGTDRHKAYRMKAQSYSEEEGQLLEDLKHGLIFGGKEFVAKIRKQLTGKLDPELPQQKRMLKDFDVETLLIRAAKFLKIDLKKVRSVKKIGVPEKDGRDLLILFLREAGSLTNTEIGTHFGLTDSSVSRRAKIIKERIATEKQLQDKYSRLKSKIKV
jgi:putative transposase